ncbi:MAG: helix-turn-helix domain-containing protein [Candidatus Cloacimonetes bacterium]|nr:helix-turn-helix domain-containing protein [Candidatus Cloacimonadota bacterium]
MQKIGTYLKQLREEQKLSLKRINELTKIRIDYLEDIETNAFKILDSYGVARAIVNNYGKALNAPEKEVLFIFDESYPHIRANTFTPRKDIRENKILISFNFIYILAISALVIIITFSLIHLYKKGSLGSPFKKNLINTEKIVEPDSLATIETVIDDKGQDKREMMKQLKETNKDTEAPQSIDTNKADYDNTDYSKELIFNNKDSVLDTD